MYIRTKNYHITKAAYQGCRVSFKAVTMQSTFKFT